MPATIEAVTLEVSVVKGEDLAAKDKGVFRKGTSDPFVVISLETTTGAAGETKRHKVGETTVKPKTLAPVWNESFRITAQQPDVLKGFDPFAGTDSVRFVFEIFDHDAVSAHDLMGVVTVPVTLNDTKKEAKWHDIPPDSAKNAKGRLEVKCHVTHVKKSPALVRGNILPLGGAATSSSGTTQKQKQEGKESLGVSVSRIGIGLSWDMLTEGTQKERMVDLDASVVAVTDTGAIAIRDTVYYGNTTNSNGSVVHSGDEREGDQEGDDETIMMDLDKVPSNIIAFYVILTVMTKDKHLSDIRSTRVRVFEAAGPSKDNLCTFAPAEDALSGDATAMFLLRIARSSVHGIAAPWAIQPIQDTHPWARDFGGLVPNIKNYTKDLIPSIHVDPTERIAIMKKGGNIPLSDFGPNRQIPDKVRVGLSWAITEGVKIDLDTSIICLGRDLNLVDTIYYKQLTSKDGAIHHAGDERKGDAVGDDEKIDIQLANVSPDITYLCILITSYSGQELDDVSRAFCHLYDPVSQTEMASYALTNSATLNGFTALLVACLYRDAEKEGDWGLCIISEPAMGKRARDTVDDFQAYLRDHPPTLPPGNQDEPEIDLKPMPDPVPIEDDIALSAPPST